MEINSYLYKNEILHQKILNIVALYDKNNHVLTFNENDEIKVSIKLNDDKIIYRRFQKDYEFLLEVNNNKALAYLTLNDLDKNIPIKVIKYYYKQKFNSILIEYELETEEKINNKILIEIKKGRL